MEDNNRNDILLDDILGGIHGFNANDAEWDTFIDQIIQGNVIPVIGPEILCENGNPHKSILKYFVRIFNVQPQINSFSELISDHNFLVHNQRDYIYSYINQVIAKSRFSPSKLLHDLLSIEQFPFVITTSFTPIVENTMKEIWEGKGKRLKVMCFNNNPEENQDIKYDIDLYSPTVYYMFGKAGDSAHRYVVTDIDMLDFCSSWIADTEGRPSKLISCLKNKYLLMIGNSYSDWLFRFIWYSLRKSGTGSGLYACDNVEDDLSRFLQRNQTILRRPPQETIDTMIDKLNEKLNGRRQDNVTNFNSVEYGADIFISYSRRDADIAEKLYEQLTHKGINVWFDRNNITAGGKFMDEIRQGIRTAKYFIPILSLNIEQEKNESHVYRIEWGEAIETSASYGRTYIIPIFENGLDFYQASIPDKLRQHNAIQYDNIEDMRIIADKIINVIK